MLLDFDDFDGFRFENDGLYNSCFVSELLKHGEFVDIEAPDMVAKYSSTFQGEVYTHKIETFVSDLSGVLLSKLHLASRRRSLIFYHANNGRYFGFGYEAGAKLSYTSQTAGGIGSLVVITANSVYPLFEFDRAIFGRYVPNFYTITVGVNPDNANKGYISATGDVISLTQIDGASYVIEASRGGTITVNIRTEEGYIIQKLDVDQVNQGGISNYTFTDIKDKHNVFVWIIEDTLQSEGFPYTFSFALR